MQKFHIIHRKSLRSIYNISWRLLDLLLILLANCMSDHSFKLQPFSYRAEIGTVEVIPWHPFISWLVYKIFVDGVYLVTLKKQDGIWIVTHPLVKELYTSDIQAIGDLIDKRYNS